MPSRFQGARLADAFVPSANSLNAIRLVLAILVVVSHSWPVTGNGPDPLIGSQDVGDWAVGGFFAISGYLITASRDTTPGFLIYLWKRFLRIYPAFICALVVVAFVAAPLSTLFTSSFWNASDSVLYVLRNAFLLIRQPAIGTTLSDAPIADSWNNPLWTLAYESACYILVGLVFSFIPRQYRVAAVIAAGTLCTLGVALATFVDLPVPVVVAKGFHLGAYFAAGALLYIGRATVVVNRTFFIISALILTVAVLLRVDAILAPLPFAFALMYAGAKLPLRSIGSRNDISYGMYIYAFPIQQFLYLAWPYDVDPLVFALASVLLTVPLAWVSYRLVEKPALRYKSLWSTPSRIPQS